MTSQSKKTKNTLIATALFSLGILLVPVSLFIRLLTDFFEAMECLFTILIEFSEDLSQEIDSFIHRNRK